MEGSDREELNRSRIEEHLKSAVSGLMPNVLDRVDLSVPQEGIEVPPYHAGYRRKRIYAVSTLMAACLCLILLAGGMYNYRNSRVDSVIGIDVNPSVELSVNRKNKVLEARALNEDAVDILSDMTLEGVDLNVAVNAVIGSMVQHGYLDDVENAILVTVSNDSVSKSAGLRAAVVEDIQASLAENQVEAVVYDQQAVELDEIKQLADEYGISYGKAYFLQELISQDPGLVQEDMEDLAPLTVEEIARKMTGGYASDKDPESGKESVGSSEESVSSAPTEESEEESFREESSSGQETGTSHETQTPPQTVETPEASTGEVAPEGKIKVDYTDYEEGVLTVNFSIKVKWKKPTVSVTDSEGNTYAASVEKTTSTSCEIRVDGLRGGDSYQFVLGGISPKIGKTTTVSGTFEAPVIGDNFEDGDGDDDTDETTDAEPSTAPSTEEETTSAPEETTGKAQSEASAETATTPAAEGSDAEEEPQQEEALVQEG